MSDGRKEAYYDEMEEWMDRQVKRFKTKDSRDIIHDLKIIINMLDDFHATDPVLTSVNHYRIATVRKTIRDLLS